MLRFTAALFLCHLLGGGNCYYEKRTWSSWSSWSSSGGTGDGAHGYGIPGGNSDSGGPMKIPKIASPDKLFNCPGGSGMTPEARKLAVDEHNKRRSDQALGKAKSEMSPVKNMYKLSYDCNLEAVIQKYMNRCKYGHSRPYDNPNGENLYARGGTHKRTIEEMVTGSC
ncbi:hypothetical protein L596_028697 [Steinernema carpocapsae]|uniref:SCP domain-containing protein n=1 Tax=Steinernema carpocapsae TaxID=34508 RepID=A0A4U5LZ45_STECR|nr:hypothetical protein L596_028697 [Steinernema carpocapsae]